MLWQIIWRREFTIWTTGPWQYKYCTYCIVFYGYLMYSPLQWKSNCWWCCKERFEWLWGLAPPCSAPRHWHKSSICPAFWSDNRTAAEIRDGGYMHAMRKHASWQINETGTASQVTVSLVWLLVTTSNKGLVSAESRIASLKGPLHSMIDAKYSDQTAKHSWTVIQVKCC